MYRHLVVIVALVGCKKSAESKDHEGERAQPRPATKVNPDVVENFADLARLEEAYQLANGEYTPDLSASGTCAYEVRAGAAGTAFPKIATDLGVTAPTTSWYVLVGHCDDGVYVTSSVDHSILRQ